MKRLLIILTFIITSCQSDINNVTIKGVIENEKTGEPQANTKISFINWYYGNSADQSYAGKEEITIVTDDDGQYQVKFDKSAFLEIIIEEKGFLRFHEAEYINSKRNTININLIP